MSKRLISIPGVLVLSLGVLMGEAGAGQDAADEDKGPVAGEDNVDEAVYLVLMSGSPPLHLIEMSSMKKCKAAAMHTPNARCVTAPEVGADFPSYKFGGIGHIKNLPDDFIKQPDDLLIKFKFDSTEITKESNKALAAVGEVLSRSKNMKLDIEGHADSMGSSDYNSKLSRERAIAIKRYFMSEWNIDSSRLRTLGKGEGEPLLGFEGDHPNNRRVEFKIKIVSE